MKTKEKVRKLENFMFDNFVIEVEMFATIDATGAFVRNPYTFIRKSH